MVNFNTSLVTFFFFLLLSQAKSFNITSLLNHYSSFSVFNNYLTQTGVVAAINSRQTITVLVVENNNLSALKGMSQDAVANIMRVHVLLDYYDVPKMQMLPNKTIKTPTLFQTTGYANNDQGFLNMTDLGTGSISLGSAAKGETLCSNLVKSIASQPYNISILQITNVIIPLGIDASTPASAPAPISSAPTYSPASSPYGSSAAPAPESPGTDVGPAPESPGTDVGPAPESPGTDVGPAPESPGTDVGPAPESPGTDVGPAPESEAAETPTEHSPAPAPHHLPPKSDAPTADTPASASADTPASASADAPAPAPTGDYASASSILDCSLVFVAMTNLFLVLVI